MEKLKKTVNEICYCHNFLKLTPFQFSLLPLLSFASVSYKLVFSLRRHFYLIGFFHKHRLPVAVISVGNLTWGGNGKTPMVEYIARWFTDSGGYAGGDEANMLQRHLSHTSTKIGVGTDRVGTAASFLKKYDYFDPHSGTWFDKFSLDKKVGIGPNSDKIGAAILDDGMQHLKLWRDLEIVMVNGMVPWGNNKVLPLGPLREPLTALKRADIIVVHHADLVPKEKLKDIELMIREVKNDLPMFFTGMVPSYFFEVGCSSDIIQLTAVHGAIVLCVSAIGFAEAFVLGIKKLGPQFVDRLDFSDHHLFQLKDIEMILTRGQELEHKFGAKPIVVVTEKDYDRDPGILKRLNPYKALVLCSQLQIIGCKECAEESFKKKLKEILQGKYSCNKPDNEP